MQEKMNDILTLVGWLGTLIALVLVGIGLCLEYERERRCGRYIQRTGQAVGVLTLIYDGWLILRIIGIL